MTFHVGAGHTGAVICSCSALCFVSELQTYRYIGCVNCAGRGIIVMRLSAFSAASVAHQAVFKDFRECNMGGMRPDNVWCSRSAWRVTVTGGTVINQWELTGNQRFMAFFAGRAMTVTTTAKLGSVTESTVIWLISG